MDSSFDNIDETEYRYSDAKLWNPKGFTYIGVIFSFLPAAILYSINYGKIGLKKERTYNLLGFIALFAALAILAIYIEGNIVRAIFVGLNIGLSAYMRNKQKDLYTKHLESGGKKASYLLPVIICMAFVGLYIGALIYSINLPENSLKFYDDELYYTKRISETEAKRIGTFLGEVEFFANDNVSINAGIDKNKSGYTFSLVVVDEAVNDAELDAYMKEIGGAMSRQVLNNQAIKLNLCNDRFKVIKTIQ